MSIHDDYSGNGAYAKPFSPLGLVIIGIIVFISIVLGSMDHQLGHS